MATVVCGTVVKVGASWLPLSGNLRLLSARY